tara:strand:+ start:43 stop:486 length:444 start_codon:yes stop_codon:yes gene_type:complete
MAVGFFGKLLHGGSKANKSGRAINTVKIAEGSLKDRRKDFESLGKRVGKHTKDPFLSEADKVELRKTIQPAAKKISALHDKKDEITKAARKRKQLKFGGGADMGSKKLSPKQMKIASLAGNKKKIDAPDFKKLRSMKSPMQKQVRKT